MKKKTIDGQVQSVIMPDLPVIMVYGDGIHDDTEAIQQYLDGKVKLIHQDGTPVGYLFDGKNNWIKGIK